MIDHTSKQVLEFIHTCDDYTFYVRKGFPEHIAPDEFLSSVDYLEASGYLTTHRVSNNLLISATLTHKGKHQKEFHSIALKRYLLDKWIDILALVISILAFIGAYRHEISAILRLIMQVLTR